MIGIKGHSTNGDGHGEYFDFFVPETERGNALSETFIIDGVGHDLYPRSLERLEDSVNLDDMALILDQQQLIGIIKRRNAECGIIVYPGKQKFSGIRILYGYA